MNNVVSVQKPRKVGEEKKKDLVRSDAAPSTAAHPVLGTDSVSPPNSPAATATTANSGSAPQRKRGEAGLGEKQSYCYKVPPITQDFGT